MDIWEYELYIFDLDDTLVKTEYYHYNAWITTIRNKLNDQTFILSFDQFCEIFHSKNITSIRDYIMNLLDIDYENFLLITDMKNKLYLSLLNDSYELLEMVDGVDQFLTNILKLHKKFVIVTNSPLNNLVFFLDRFPILKNASKLYYREMFKNKKPNPECYMMVDADYPNLKKIGFEDSITGILALLQVNSITPIFINNKTYVHYDTIITLYDKIYTIENYLLFII